MTISTKHTIPTIDLSPFFKEGENDEGGMKKVIESIRNACSEYGFFQIVNHGVPTDLMARAIELSRTFFDYSDEEKKKASSNLNAPFPAGYGRQPLHSSDKNEYVFVFSPETGFNVYPQNPPGFREVLDEIFKYLSKTGLIIESIINECIGLPHGFLNQFNHDRRWDFMAALRYFPATDVEDTGISEHEDGNLFTFVFQDEAGGLEVWMDGEWIPVTPIVRTIVVNISDVIQVLSNKKLKSETHRVVRPKGKSRYSYAFFHNLQGDKWIEPLPQFTTQIGEPPKYRGFLYKEYQALRRKNKTHPPEEDVIHITHYAITS